MRKVGVGGEDVMAAFLSDPVSYCSGVLIHSVPNSVLFVFLSFDLFLVSTT